MAEINQYNNTNPYLVALIKGNQEAMQQGSQAGSRAIQNQQDQARELGNQIKLAGVKSQLESQGKSQEIQEQHAADLQGEQQRLKQAQDLYKQGNGKQAVNLSKEGVSLSPHENLQALMHQEQFQDKQATALSDRYNKVGGFSQALQDLDKTTDQDGKGGILTNPGAQMKSFGQFASKIPDSGVGLAELTGAMPKGSSAERQAVAQLQLQYARAMSGARMNPAMIQKEKDAMGYMLSGDPDLIKKGIGHLADNISNNIKTTQAGFSPAVKDQVHQVMGDPMDFYNKLQQPSGGPAVTPSPQQVQQTQQPIDPVQSEIQRRQALRAKKIQQTALPQSPQQSPQITDLGQGQ